MNMRVVALMMVVPAVIVAKAQQERRVTVDELFQLVESNSKTLQEQKISVEFADKGVEVARAQRLPDVSARLSAAYNGNVLVMDRDLSNAHGYSAPHLGTSFALEAQQVVYAGGAIDAGIRVAELQRDMAVSSRRATLSGQRFQALGQYLDLIKIQNRQRVYEQNIALAQRLIDDIRAKHEQGMALRNDVTRYELQMETLRLGLRKLQDEQAIVNYQLCNTLGLKDVVLVPDSAVAQGQVPMTLENRDWLQTALTSSPAAEQSELATRLAHQQLRLAKSELLPKVALVAADNLSGPFTYDLPPIDKTINYWYVGVGVNYNISSLFKADRKVKQAVSGVSRSEAHQQVTAESLSNQVQQAYTLYLQSFAELETQQKSVELARQNYQVVNDRYLSQLALITDMLDASNIRLSAELQEVDACINIVYNYFKMKFISGIL